MIIKHLKIRIYFFIQKQQNWALQDSDILKSPTVVILPVLFGNKVLKSLYYSNDVSVQHNEQGITATLWDKAITSFTDFLMVQIEFII
jgi:hypothetical protein